jgi:hypothetical protein
MLRLVQSYLEGERGCEVLSCSTSHITRAGLLVVELLLLWLATNAATVAAAAVAATTGMAMR